MQLGSNYSQIPVTGFDEIMAGQILPVALDSVALAVGLASLWTVGLPDAAHMEKNYSDKSIPPQGKSY